MNLTIYFHTMDSRKGQMEQVKVLTFESLLVHQKEFLMVEDTVIHLVLLMDILMVGMTGLSQVIVIQLVHLNWMDYMMATLYSFEYELVQMMVT